MSEQLTLYTNPMSRGRIARWALEEAGAEYETQIIEYGPAMKSTDYLAINPMGKVPAIRHGETVVTETPAICAYLADAFPDAGLAPPPRERGSYYRWLFFAAGPLEAATTARMMGFAPEEDQQKMAGFGSLDLTLDVLDQALQKSPYITGENFTAADIYLGSHIGWGMQFGTIGARPAFEDYWRRVSGREACARANELDGPMPETA